MALWDEIEANYLSKYGQVAHQPCSKDDPYPSLNGLLYSSIVYILLAKEAERAPFDTTPERQLWIQKIIWDCWVSPGLLCRAPKHGDQEAQDDYLGVLAASAWGDRHEARMIYGYGKAWCPIPWVYNNVTPGKWTKHSWLGRHLAFPACVKFAAGVKPNWLERFFFRKAFTLAKREPVTNNDAWLMSWLMLEIANKAGYQCQEIEDWKVELYKKSPHGMRAIIPRCFAYDPGHPIVKYFPEKI